MSDVTPEEIMDLATLDGFLTSLVIGPEVVPPSSGLRRSGAARTSRSSSRRRKRSA
jgi:hypothetical protein